MASSKEMQHPTRPSMHQRPSMTSSSLSAVTGRLPHARANSHSHSGSSLFGGSLNPSHRVTRRKSVTTPSANAAVAAITAAIRDSEPTASASASAAAPVAAPAAAAMPILHVAGGVNGANGARRLSKQLAAKYALTGSLPAAPAPANMLSPTLVPSEAKPQGARDDVIDDDSNDLSADEAAANLQKSRTRRASDGQPLTTKEGKKSTRVEIRCETCGKGYKHSSCLTKHLWEHTPEWSLTSKLLISKHQQVQLLEAASVLVAMNGNPKDRSSTPPDSAKDFASDPESASPTASGYSEQAERQSSADTTPPPLHETSYFGRRQSSSRAFSPGFQSPLSRQLSGGSSVPNDGQFGPFRQISYGPPPDSSERNPSGEDDHELAAAVELLSCSFNSKTGFRGDVASTPNPPFVCLVPPILPLTPVPAPYLDQAASLTSAGFINSYPSKQPESFTRGETRRGSEDVKMEDSEDDYDMRPRARSDEEDDGVFGRMEE